MQARNPAASEEATCTQNRPTAAAIRKPQESNAGIVLNGKAHPDLQSIIKNLQKRNGLNKGNRRARFIRDDRKFALKGQVCMSWIKEQKYVPIFRQEDSLWTWQLFGNVYRHPYLYVPSCACQQFARNNNRRTALNSEALTERLKTFFYGSSVRQKEIMKKRV